MDFVWKSYACFNENCVKSVSNRKQELGISNIDSFSRFNMNKITWLMEIYYEPYYMQDNIELSVIHSWSISGFKVFLIFERHAMFPLVTLLAQWIGFPFTGITIEIYFPAEKIIKTKLRIEHEIFKIINRQNYRRFF
jgi:hypothetical protein